MKKLFITLFTTLLIGNLFAETTVKMLDNSQYGAANSFQAKVADIIPTDYQAKVGDIITVKLAGSSNYDLTGFQIVFSDTRPEVNYWKELSGWKSFNDTQAGVNFDYSTSAIITNDAAGAGGTFCNLILEAVSVAAVSASANEVTLTLSTFEITIESPEDGVITLSDNNNGERQGDFPDTLATTPVVKVNDVVRVTIAGTSNVDISDFKAAVIDGTEAANYWKELSSYTLFGNDGTVTANTPFTLTADISITDVPVGTGFKSQFIVIKGTANEDIKLSLTTFTAEIIENETTANILINTQKPVIINTSLYNCSGVLLSKNQSTESLKNGIYIMRNEYSDGSIRTQKIMRKR